MANVNCSTPSAIKTAGRVEAQPPHEISTVFYCRDLELELPSEFFVKEKEKGKDQTRDVSLPEARKGTVVHVAVEFYRANLNLRRDW